jgi:hypothetical protein
MAQLTWETAADWDAAQSESGVVHDSFGDRVGSEIWQGYPADPLGDGSIQRYIPLDEDSGASGGTAADVSGNNNDHTYQVTSLGNTGILGSTCPSFDGNDDYVGGPTSFRTSATDPFFACAWVKPETDLTVKNIWANHEGGTSTGFKIASGPDDENNEWELGAFHSGGGFNRLYAGKTPSLGTWYLVGGGFDGSQYIVRVRGGHTVDVTGTFGTTDVAPGSDPLDIGRSPFYDENWQGNIDEAMLFNKALTASEMDALYQATQSGSLTTAVKTA